MDDDDEFALELDEMAASVPCPVPLQRLPAGRSGAAAVAGLHQPQARQSATASDLQQCAGVFRHETDSAAEVANGNACQPAQPVAFQPSAAPTRQQQCAPAKFAAGAQQHRSQPSANTEDGPSQLDIDMGVMPEGLQPQHQRNLSPAQPPRQDHLQQQQQLGHGVHALISDSDVQHRQPASARPIMCCPPVAADQQPAGLLRAHNTKQGRLDAAHRCSWAGSLDSVALLALV